MRSLLLIGISLFGLRSAAQTVYTIDDAPEIGDQFTVRIGTYIDLPQTGSDQTWDYSGITGGAAISYEVGSVPADHADQYPNTTIVVTGTGNSEFFEVDSIGLISYGSADEIGWNQLQLEVPFRRIAFPLYHGAGWQDDWSGVQNNIIINGTRSCVANGSGDLILPWGTVQDVIRVTCMDQAELGNTPTNIEVASVSFYANGFPWELLHATERSSFENGQQIAPTQYMLLYATEASVVTVDEMPFSGSQLFVYTDRNGDLVIVPDRSKSRLEIQLYNIMGTSILQRTSSDDPVIFSTQDLPIGTYILHAIDAHGRSFKRKVLIAR